MAADLEPVIPRQAVAAAETKPVVPCQAVVAAETKKPTEYRVYILTVTTESHACDTFQRNLLWSDDYGKEGKGRWCNADILAAHLCLLLGEPVSYNCDTKTWSKASSVEDEPAEDTLRFEITKYQAFMRLEDRDFAMSLDHSDFDNDHDSSGVNTRLVTDDFTSYAATTMELSETMI
jgi:hypothetical protein